MPEIPRLALPLRVENGSYAVNEQDTVDDVANCVESIVRYEREYLPFLPDFGRPPILFRQGTEPLGSQLRAAVEAWEDRGELLTDDQLDELAREIRLTVGERG